MSRREAFLRHVKVYEKRKEALKALDVLWYQYDQFTDSDLQVELQIIEEEIQKLNKNRPLNEADYLQSAVFLRKASV